MNYVQFDGNASYCEVPDSPALSVATSGSLSIAAWMRPDTLDFPVVEGSGYVHWLGKGQTGRQEWTFRMYSQGNSENRANRISFYVFHPDGGQGIGAYVQEPVSPGEWIHLVGVVDGALVHIYKNGDHKNAQEYGGKIAPVHGSAPVRFGTRDFHSFFQGALGEIRIWQRAISADEVMALHEGSSVPDTDLVAEYLFDLGQDSAGGHDAVVKGALWGSDPARAMMTSGFPSL